MSPPLTPQPRYGCGYWDGYVLAGKLSHSTMSTIWQEREGVWRSFENFKPRIRRRHKETGGPFGPPVSISNPKLGFSTPDSHAVSWSAKGGAACAAPLPRSG